MDRRTFILGTAAAAIHGSRLLARWPAANVELGSIDGSVGGNNFTAVQFLDYLSSIKLTWAMVSLPPATLGDESAIRQIREHADRLGIRLQLAFRFGLPERARFNAQLGTLEEQVARALKASQIFGATCMRCILGGDPERPQIDMHIDNMIKAVRGIRSRILDSGVKLAVENHGGDLQSREMKTMVEAVGRDVMGVCLDSGNPVWMLEDPHMTLEMLSPYAETCHVRDSAVWKVPEGIAVRWVNMGDGNVDIDGWIRKFIQVKPGLPIIFENLVSGDSAYSRDLQPAVLGQLAQDAGLGVESISCRCGERHAEAGDAASRREDGRATADRRSRRVRALHAKLAATHLNMPRTRVFLFGAGFHRRHPRRVLSPFRPRRRDRRRLFEAAKITRGRSRRSTAFGSGPRISRRRSPAMITTSPTSVCPNHLHAKTTIGAAAAGKHVILEKPLCLTIEEADEMIAACAAHNRKLMYAEELCFAPKYERVRQLVREGALGDVYYLRQLRKALGSTQRLVLRPSTIGRRRADGYGMPWLRVVPLDAAR